MKKNSDEKKDGRKVKDHYCVECKMTFSSGKALRDHMNRAHAQSNRDFSVKKQKSKMEFEAMNRVPSHVLDGDRINSGHVFGLNESMKWQVTGMRGRAATKQVIDSPLLAISDEFLASLHELMSASNGDSMKPSEDLDSKVKEGEANSSKFKGSRTPIKPVIGLSPFPSSEEFLRLINGDSKKPSEDLESKVREGEIDGVNQDFQSNKNNEVLSFADERNSPAKKLKIFERADENPGGKQFRRIDYNGKGNRKLYPGFQTENSTNSSMNPGDNPYESGTNGSMMIKKKSMDPESLLDFTPVEPEAAKDNYSTCEKSFPTCQAMGRHRSSSHKEKKVKVKIYNTVADPSLNGAAYANATEQMEVNSASGFQNHADHVPRSHQVTSTDEEKEDPNVFEFNLNEPPDHDDEDGMEPGSSAS
ncbi:uncharacterized protein LOC111412795 [Olea europaea var. sylvestris]|nr:uncharacterized protein LOC111412795 [Olea europaea var. sylvestris]